jgi:hypothetical protein
MRIASEPFFLLLVVLAFLAWTVWLRSRRRMAQVQLQHKLLDKFNSPQEIGDFLQTEGGRRFLQGMTTGRRDAGMRILLALQIGTVVSLLGIATLGLGFVYPMSRPGEPHPAVIFGALVLALGVGFLISAGISYRLSKAWGLSSEAIGKPADSY